MLNTATCNASFLSITILFLLIVCSNNNQSDKASSENSTSQQEHETVDSNVIKVYVYQDGKITADWKEITISNLDSSLNKLKPNGIVYYSRDNGRGDPRQESMKVMELIVKYNLPVKLFTDKTFSVTVKPN